MAVLRMGFTSSRRPEQLERRHRRHANACDHIRVRAHGARVSNRISTKYRPFDKRERAMTHAPTGAMRPNSGFSERKRWFQLMVGVVCMVATANIQYAWTLF